MNPPESPGQLTTPHASKPRLPVTIAAARKLAEVGLPAIVERIVAGDSHAKIAESLGIGRSSLSGYLVNLRGEDAALYSEAMRASAENLYQQALDELRAAPSTSADVQKARAIADVLLKVAGVRDARWRDRISQATAVTLNAPQQAPARVPRFIITIAAPVDPGRTFEHDPDG